VSGIPADVAVSPDGSLVGAVVQTDGDSYELVPIDAATGIKGEAVDLGSFANPNQYVWSNPPKIRGASAEPPAAWFAPSGGTMWIYNNVRHVAVQLHHGASAPVARKAETRLIRSTRSLDPNDLEASTPDGRTLVLSYNAGDPLLQVSTFEGGLWSTSGLAPLKLCASNPCQFSISPNGTTLAVRSLSALQVIDLRTAAASASRITASQGTQNDSVVASPTGVSARWNARAVALLDAVTGTYQRVPVALHDNARISTVGFTPGGRHLAALVSRDGRCPCRLVLVDASSRRVVREVVLGGTALDRRVPTAIALNDAADLAAVTFDDRPNASTGVHRAGLVTYAADSGRPLQVVDNAGLGLGDSTVSVPAFQPAGETVALVARTSGGQVTGVLMDARTGAIAGRLALRAGAATVKGLEFRNGGYALRFSPDGRLLAWNRGGSVVLWPVGDLDGRTIASQAVLTSSDWFDPTALAVSDDGAVATVGVNTYVSGLSRNHAVILVGDQLGRHLEPLGIGRFVTTDFDLGSLAAIGKMSVAVTSSGELFSVALASDGSRIFSDSYGASPGSLLQQLCAAASAVLTTEQWETYFPGEPFRPACTPPTAPSPWSFDVPHRMAVQPVGLAVRAEQRVASSRPVVVKTPIPRARPQHRQRLPEPAHRRSATSRPDRSAEGAEPAKRPSPRRYRSSSTPHHERRDIDKLAGLTP
jgi:hypothetical protein